MMKKKTLPELYAIRDRNNALVAKITKRQRALGDTIKADEKMLDTYTRRERTPIAYAQEPGCWRAFSWTRRH